MKRPFHAIQRVLPPILLGALFALVLTTGCSTAMTGPHTQLGEGDVARNTFPLKFKMHNFGAYCFNAKECKVLYAGMYHVRKDENETSPPPLPDYLNRMSASTIAIDNFPPPAIVTWRSMDGAYHEANIDIGTIFKDQRILHHVPEDQIPVETAAFDAANIILVVNDRTISVYMKTTIYLNKPRNPSNPLSNTSHEITSAYSRTY